MMNPLTVQFIVLAAWAILGILIGKLLYRLADFLPRFAAEPCSLAPCARFRGRPRGARLQGISRLLGLDNIESFAIQLLTGLAFAYFWTRYGLTGTFLLQSSVFCFLILVAIVDLKYRLILNAMIFPASAAVLIRAAFLDSNPQYFWGSNLLAALIGGAFGLTIFLLASFIRPGELGAGDVKLATLIGLAFAFPNAIWALMIGIFAGGAAAIFLLLTRHASRTSQMPYAPFLCLGALIVMFYNPLWTM